MSTREKIVAKLALDIGVSEVVAMKVTDALDELAPADFKTVFGVVNNVPTPTTATAPIIAKGEEVVQTTVAPPVKK